MADIEKISRKIVLEKATPHDYYLLNHTCNILRESFSGYDGVWREFIQSDAVVKEMDQIQQLLKQHLYIEKAMNLHELDETCEKLIRSGIDLELDRACQEKMESKDKFYCILQYLNQVYHQLDRKCTEGFKVHETDKQGVSLLITKRRKLILENSLVQNTELTFYSTYTENNETFTFSPSMITFKEHNSTTFEVDSPEINLLTRQMLSTTQLFKTHLCRVFKTIHGILNVSYEKTIQCIQKMDVLNTKCEIASKYNYSKPVIVKSDQSYLDAKGLRHVLIEHLEKQEIYVPNDVCLGKDPRGLLLFGTNAVGKTSLIKAIGICIIMAQAGLYVPCSYLEYSPYEYLFTRIINNDNMFKGLSTFAVEMSELRVILQQCNKNSLILGDELCSGTEIDSALSIFVAGLETMYERESTFIFATHFHMIQHFEEVRKMSKLALKHLTVQYNHEIKKLVYGRKLCEGAGESVYGLEVCKSLCLPDSFMTRAYEIRNRNDSSVLSLKESKYNKAKLRGVCEFCRETIGSEIHHLRYQKEAKGDFIEGFHKDHAANLASVCEKCHQHIHALGLVYEKKKTMDGYQLILNKN
jgi:DNA mismatch repair protein MutS